jgi:hypothetical protein
MAVRKTTKKNRGLVDAPGKRHRKPPPQERIDKRMGESRGKQMGHSQAICLLPLVAGLLVSTNWRSAARPTISGAKHFTSFRPFALA